MKWIYHWLFPTVWWAFILYWLISAFWALKPKVREPGIQRLIHYGFGALAFMILAYQQYFPATLDRQLWPEDRTSFWTGAAVTVAGLGFAVWARIHLGRYWSAAITLKEGHRLIRSGPYRWVRNPIYTGILTGVLGTAIALGRTRGLAALFILYLTYSWKIHREQRLLAGEFGEEYAAYCREVPSLVPYKFPKRQ